MSQPSFIPDNFLARLAKKLAGAAGKAALGKLSDDFGDPVFLAKNYIQPSCQLDNPTMEGSDTGPRRPVFGMLNEFFGSQSSAARQSCLFLLGDTGTGKTSLLLMLKLGHLTGLWPREFHGELLKLGPSTMGRIADIKSPRRTILMLDALDEDPEASTDILSRVTEIRRATRDFHWVILSCRTPYFPGDRLEAVNQVENFVSHGLGCPTISLSLFNPTQIDKYLKRRFPRMKEPNRKRFKSILHHMGPLRDRPLLLHHADDFVHSRRKDWNAFSTYDVLVDAWLDREQSKLRTSESSKEALFTACERLAQAMHMSESRHGVPRSAMGESNLQDTDIALIEKLDCQGRSLLRRTTTKAFRFTHVSIQEFLAARGLKNGLLPSGKKKLPATDLIITFLIECDDAATQWKALDLTLAGLNAINLHNPDFSRTLLASANLAKSTFHGANFDHAILTSILADEAKFSVCTFLGVKAANASLASVEFSGCQFTHTTLGGSAMPGAHFDGCQLEHTLLADSILNANLFSRTSITDCSFKSSRLSTAEFRNCSLAKVRFDRSCLAGAKFSNTTLQEVSLQSADLRGADLDATFLTAIKNGAVKNWKTAAWDPAVAASLKLSPKENDRNAQSIDRSQIS